jgi:hypothetical protein
MPQYRKAADSTWRIFSLFVALSLATAARSQELEQRTQSFDSEPDWEGQNNFVDVEPNPVVQEFGYSQTAHAGGKRGEIGGRIQRGTTPAWYGKRLPRKKTLDDRLHCSGKFVVTETSGMSSFYFGWFNTQTMETRPRNWMGLMINGEGKGCEVHVGYNTAAGQSDGFRATGVGPRGAAVRDFNLIPVGTVYTFDFLYDPSANDGNGRITFSLGGDGPFTGGPFTFDVPAQQRKAGAEFDRFGMVNAQSAGNALSIWFDDLSIDGELDALDDETAWGGEGNRGRYDDYGVEGAHRFGFSKTSHAGGEAGELGGLIYSAPSTPGYYADRVGKLTLEDRLVASGRVCLKKYGSDGGCYFGWFHSNKRGYPPENLLGVLIDGTTSTGPRLQAVAASSDAKLSHVARDRAPLLSPDGQRHRFRIEYDPSAANHGRLTVWLDEHKHSVDLPQPLRTQGAVFDRFGLCVHEGGGRVSEIYVDELEYTASLTPDP